MESQISDGDYERLLTLRTGLRRFLRWSEEQAVGAGLTPSQHQLLLAARGHRDLRGPTITDIAGYLLLRHHSAVELVDRAEEMGLIRRRKDPDDHRLVRLSLAPRGEHLLEKLSERHLEELGRLATRMGPLLSGLDKPGIRASR